MIGLPLLRGRSPIARRVIVTGASGALGTAVVSAFLGAGCSVAAIDRSKDRRPTDPPRGLYHFDGVDLRDAEVARTAFDTARTALGGADVLVHLAGAFVWSPLTQDTLEVWSALFDANLLTCANICAAAATGLSDGGSIVNLGAAAAEHAGAGMGAYAASKAGVARLTESLAAELQGRIRVNAILPLIVDTPRNRADMPNADPADWTSPAAIADLAVFLASDASRAVNGALIPATAPQSPIRASKP